MRYFKNTELARIYKVSEKSVRNWIEAAQNGKLDLQLHNENGRDYVANISKNTRLVETLVQRGKKYKNTRGHKTVMPSPKFYSVYDSKEVFDIISALEIHRELPYQYSYFDDGARYWDQYAQKMIQEKTPNALNNTMELFASTKEYIGRLLHKYKNVNVVDIGPGNGLPVRPILEYLQQTGQLKRYIGIDLSPDMLRITKENITTWFDGAVHAEEYIKDITHDRFDELLVDESFGDDAESTTNLVLFLGGTIANLRQPDRALSAIHDSMSKNDVFILTQKLDTEGSRRYFDFVAQSTGDNKVFRGKMLLDLLGIDESLYTMDQRYDQERSVREIEVKLSVAVSIVFTHQGKKRVVEINKGESIILWHADHQSAIDVIRKFDNNDFETLQTTKASDREYFQVVSRIKTQ